MNRIVLNAIKKLVNSIYLVTKIESSIVAEDECCCFCCLVAGK